MQLYRQIDKSIDYGYLPNGSDLRRKCNVKCNENFFVALFFAKDNYNGGFIVHKRRKSEKTPREGNL